MFEVFFKTFQPFIIALALGFLIGTERERSHPEDSQAIGLRTIILIAVLGALTGFIENSWIALGITFFVGGLIIAGYQRSSSFRVGKPDFGLTTEMAAGVTYILGYIAHLNAFLTLFLGMVVLLVLISRDKMHYFSRTQLKASELKAAVILLVIAIVILPLIPDQTLDPWKLFNPRRFVYIFLIILILQFGGYIMTRIFGSRFGIPLSGFLSGFVSSTLTVALLPKLVKEKPALSREAAASAVLATIATLLQFLIIVTMASPHLFDKIILPISVAVSIGGLAAFLLTRERPVKAELPLPQNPLAMWTALRLALLLVLMIGISKAANQWFGLVGGYLVSFLAALFDLHGISMAVANLEFHGQISLPETLLNLAIAVLASFASKFFLTWVMVRNRYALTVSLVWVLMIAGGFAAAWLGHLL